MSAGCTWRRSWTSAHGGSWGSPCPPITTRSWRTARWRWRLRSGAGTGPGVIFHTDQGSEYTAGLVRAACELLGIRQSMGRPGSALDNAAIESWHSPLEFELRSREHFATRAQARTRIAAWIDEYNTIRRHSAIGMIPPAAFEAGQQDGRAA